MICITHSIVEKESYTLLQQHHTSKPIIQVPEINRAHPPLVVQLSVDIKRLIGLDFHFSYTLAWNGTLASAFIAASCANAASAGFVEGGVELVGPGGAVRVAVTVVIAEEVITAGLLAALDGERLVDRGEKLFGEVGVEGDDVGEVVTSVFWVEAAEEVPVCCCSVSG